MNEQDTDEVGRLRSCFIILKYYTIDRNWTVRCLVNGHNWEESFEQPNDRSQGHHLFNCNRCGEAFYGHESELE